MTAASGHVAAALLDWDGTLRPAFTMAHGTEFLAHHNYFPAEAAREIADARDAYFRSPIRANYIRLADTVADRYRTGLAGRSAPEIADLADAFAAADELCPYTRAVLDLLAEHTIYIMVISGTAHELLEGYQRTVLRQINEVYGLRIIARDGRWTGELDVDMADESNKARKVAELRDRFSIKVAIGDSRSDRPMLEAAALRLYLGDSPAQLDLEEVVAVDKDTIVPTLRELLRTRR